MAMVHNCLEMWQGCQNLRATKKESYAQNRQIIAIGYFSDTEMIIKAASLKFQHNGAAAFKLSERSPLQPALSAKNVPGGQTKVLNVCRMRRIERHPSEGDGDCTPDGIANTGISLDWNCDEVDPNESEDDCVGDNQSGIELCSVIESSESPEHSMVSVALNVGGLIRPTRKSMKQAEKWVLTVSAMETRSHKGNKKK